MKPGVHQLFIDGVQFAHSRNKEMVFTFHLEAEFACLYLEEELSLSGSFVCRNRTSRI